MNEKKLKARDFITIGIFTAILWVVQMVIMYLGFLSPFIVAGYAVLIPIVTGIPMMLYYARIEKFGMLTITSIIVAILLFIFGMGFLGAPICIAAGVVADLIAKSGKYKSWKKPLSVAACSIFGSVQVIFLSYLQQTLISKACLKADLMPLLQIPCLRL